MLRHIRIVEGILPPFDPLVECEAILRALLQLEDSLVEGTPFSSFQSVINKVEGTPFSTHNGIRLAPSYSEEDHLSNLNQVQEEIDLSKVASRLRDGYYEGLIPSTVLSSSIGLLPMPEVADIDISQDALGHPGFASDVRLVFSNCVKRLGTNGPLSKAARTLERRFEAMYRDMILVREAENEEEEAGIKGAVNRMALAGYNCLRVRDKLEIVSWFVEQLMSKPSTRASVELAESIYLEDLEFNSGGEMCAVCQDTKDGDKMLLCDGCDAGYHTYCLKLQEIPSGDWFCEECEDEREVETNPEESQPEQEVRRTRRQVKEAEDAENEALISERGEAEIRQKGRFGHVLRLEPLVTGRGGERYWVFPGHAKLYKESPKGGGWSCMGFTNGDERPGRIAKQIEAALTVWVAKESERKKNAEPLSLYMSEERRTEWLKKPDDGRRTVRDELISIEGIVLL